MLRLYVTFVSYKTQCNFRGTAVPEWFDLTAQSVIRSFPSYLSIARERPGQSKAENILRFLSVRNTSEFARQCAGSPNSLSELMGYRYFMAEMKRFKPRCCREIHESSSTIQRVNKILPIDARLLNAQRALYSGQVHRWRKCLGLHYRFEVTVRCSIQEVKSCLMGSASCRVSGKPGSLSEISPGFRI
jgi:hypothetical protein